LLKCQQNVDKGKGAGCSSEQDAQINSESVISTDGLNPANSF
jgi:hypothetical protein